MHTTTAGVIFALLLSSAASAQTWDETLDGGGDSGDLPSTAQSVSGGGPLTTLTGDITPGADVDMFLINITSMVTFSADTAIAPGTLDDTKLYLFDIAGLGIAFNDDTTGLKAMLPAGDPLYAALPAGLYLLAITCFDNDPNSAGGLIFPDMPFTSILGPTGPGGAQPLTSWTNNVANTGTYTITLTGAAFVTTSAPTINLSAVTTFTGDAVAGFDMTVPPGATLVTADLDLFDADGDPIDLNSVTVAPTAIAGVTQPPSPQLALASGTTISWTGTVAPAATPQTYFYTVNIDDNVNPAQNIVVRISVVVGAPPPGGGGGTGGGRGEGGASGFLPCGAAATATTGSAWLALLALAAMRTVRRRFRTGS